MKKKKIDPEKRKKKLERIDKKKKKISSELKDLDLKKIRKNVRPDEKEYLEEYIWMFRKIGRLIRQTEKRARENDRSREVYALSTLISQQREIIADIRTLADLSGQIEQLKELALRPMVSAIGQNLLDGYYQLRTLLMQTTKPKETKFALTKLEEIIKEESRFLQIQYHKGSESISGIMGGTYIEPIDGKIAGRKSRKPKAVAGKKSVKQPG